MAAAGLPPTYFDFDNFQEIQVSTAGQNIAQQTGGVGINFVTKRGTNQFHGAARGYFTNNALQSSNVPGELANAATPVTASTADHNQQISDYGVEFGGPIRADRAWFFASYSSQDIRLVRRAGALVDRTQLKNPQVKLNWQADKQDIAQLPVLQRRQGEGRPQPAISGILFDARRRHSTSPTPTATFRCTGSGRWPTIA